MTLPHTRTLTLLALALLLTTSVWFFVHNRTKQSVQNATPHNTPQQEIAQHTPSKKTPSAQTAQQNNTTAPAQQVTTDTSHSAGAGGEIDTSNWKEYCNEEYGFCVKYPEGWEVTQKNIDKCNNIAEGVIISPSYTRSNKYCEGPEDTTDAMLGVFYSYGFYVSAIGDSNYDAVRDDNANTYLVLNSKRRIFDDILMTGNGGTCNHVYKEGDTTIGLQLIDPPKKWREENQIVVTCRNSKYAPILKKIFSSIRFSR